MRGSQLDADHVVALQKVMRRCCDLWGKGLSLHCFIILGTNVQLTSLVETMGVYWMICLMSYLWLAVMIACRSVVCG